MLKRKAMKQLVRWREHKTSQALLVTGARQVGKTHLIRAFAAQNYEHVVEINFIDNTSARLAFASARDSTELFLRLSAFAGDELVAGRTLIFFDEVQECKEVVTAIKFLLERFSDYDYILSGSLLGTELNDIRSVPVGFLTTVEMFPLDFEEFCWAHGVNRPIFDALEEAVAQKRPVDQFIHERLHSLFYEYLIVGGMPEAVQAFSNSHNIQTVRHIQDGIIHRYREDIAKYNKPDSREIKRIFDLIPSELSQQNKRFIISSVENDARFNRYKNLFLWLADAGVALPVYNVREPRYPLMLSMTSNYFKLFLGDVGLLTCMCGMDVVRDVINRRPDINFGALYENAVAQELRTHGFSLYYYKNRIAGELDFVIEYPQGKIVPIEVKSGKHYKRHNALSKVLSISNYGIDEAIVLCEGNVEIKEKTLYLPIYMVSLLEQE